MPERFILGLNESVTHTTLKFVFKVKPSANRYGHRILTIGGRIAFFLLPSISLNREHWLVPERFILGLNESVTHNTLKCVFKVVMLIGEARKHLLLGGSLYSWSPSLTQLLHYVQITT